MRNRLLAIFGGLVLLAGCSLHDEPTIPDSPWELAQPSEVGVSEARLLIGDGKIESGVYGFQNSLVIIKDDKLIFENYYRGTDRNRLVDIGGSTVSVSAIVAGIALEQNIIPGLDTEISELLSDQTPFEDPLRAQITFEHLISMRTGIAWNELLRPFNDPQNSASRMTQTPDWANFTLNEIMEAVPGGRFAYSSGAYMVLSKIIRQNSGKTLMEYTEENLFTPLDITTTWESDPSGNTTASWGLRMNTRDMAKIGYLALNGGNYFGRQLLSEDYVSEMGSLQSQFTFNNDFGYGWWRFSDFSPLVLNIEENDIFFSWGSGGQFIFVVPHENMVVAMTANNFPPEGTEQLGFSLLFEDIIPSIGSSL